MQLRLRATLHDDAGVIGAVVVVADPRRAVAGVVDGRRCLAFELLGQREQEHDQRVLVVRGGLQGVPANAFGFTPLVEQPIPLRRRERSWYGRRGEGLEIEWHGRLAWYL